jgi:hypothetical protein
VEVLPDERGETSCAFLRRAVAWLAERGVKVERVMTGNGSPYRSVVHAATCTNGKAERFIQTMLREWPTGALRKLLRETRPTRRLAQSLQLPPKARLPRPSPAGCSS